MLSFFSSSQYFFPLFQTVYMLCLYTAPFNTSASVAKTNPNRAPLQHMMTNGSATTGTEQAVSVARNGGINKELASSDKRIFVVSGAKSNGRIPKKDAPVSEQPFAKGRQVCGGFLSFL